MPDGSKETRPLSVQDKKSLLLAHTFIESLDDEDVDRLAHHARLMTFSTGETIFQYRRDNFSQRRSRCQHAGGDQRLCPDQYDHIR